MCMWRGSSALRFLKPQPPQPPCLFSGKTRAFRAGGSGANANPSAQRVASGWEQTTGPQASASWACLGAQSPPIPADDAPCAQGLLLPLWSERVFIYHRMGWGLELQQVGVPRTQLELTVGGPQ